MQRFRLNARLFYISSVQLLPFKNMIVKVTVEPCREHVDRFFGDRTHMVLSSVFLYFVKRVCWGSYAPDLTYFILLCSSYGFLQQNE